MLKLAGVAAAARERHLAMKVKARIRLSMRTADASATSATLVDTLEGCVWQGCGAHEFAGGARDALQASLVCLGEQRRGRGRCDARRAVQLDDATACAQL